MAEHDVDAPRADPDAKADPREQTSARLLALLEKAAEGSRELDLSIADFLGFEHSWDTAGDDAFICRKGPSDVPRVCDLCPRFTRSLDAALSLVPEGWGFLLECWTNTTRTWARLNRPGTDADGSDMIGGMVTGPRSEGATAPLALCLAALRARQAKP